MIQWKRYWKYILMKKVIILRKIQVAMKTFAPPFFNLLSLTLNRQKKHGLGPWERNYRSSGCSQIFFKIDVLKNFANFTGKHLRWNLFLITLQVLRPSGRKLYYKKTSTQVFSSGIWEILNAFNLVGRTYMSWRIFLSDLMLNMYVLKHFSKILWVD